MSYGFWSHLDSNSRLSSHGYIFPHEKMTEGLEVFTGFEITLSSLKTFFGNKIVLAVSKTVAPPVRARLPMLSALSPLRWDKCMFLIGKRLEDGWSFPANQEGSARCSLWPLGLVSHNPRRTLSPYWQSSVTILSNRLQLSVQQSSFTALRKIENLINLLLNLPHKREKKP